MVWYSHLFPNFPQFVVIHTVKGFGIVNEAEVDIFSVTLLPFLYPTVVGSLISGSNCCFLTCLQVSQEAGQVA